MVEAANHTGLWAGSVIITGPEVRPVEDAAADFLCSHAPRRAHTSRLASFLRGSRSGDFGLDSEGRDDRLAARADRPAGCRPDLAANRKYANELLAKVRAIPGIADARIQQAFQQPTLNVNVDRSLTSLAGLTEKDIATGMLTTLSGSSQSARPIG